MPPPFEYVGATYRLCLERASGLASRARSEEKKSKRGADKEFCFAPLRTSCIPKHVKIDTETLSQITVPYKKAVAARKEAPSMLDFNNWVWNRALDRKKVDRKLRMGFCFHHEITTDGVCLFLSSTQDPNPRQRQKEQHNRPRNGRIATRPQRRPPSIAATFQKRGAGSRKEKPGRHDRRRQGVPQVHCETEDARMTELQTKLLERSHRTNNLDGFWMFLEAKRKFDESSAGEFYQRDVWRNWRFRTFAARKSSEDRLLDRVAAFYGKECHIYYRDWSRSPDASLPPWSN